MKKKDVLFVKMHIKSLFTEATWDEVDGSLVLESGTVFSKETEVYGDPLVIFMRQEVDFRSLDLPRVVHTV